MRMSQSVCGFCSIDMYKMDPRGAEIIACVSTNKRANCGTAIRGMEWEQVGAIME